MSDDSADPSGSTEQFRAFVRHDPPAPPERSRLPLIIGVSAAVVVVVVVVVLLAI
jgi:hypothetical protein